MIRSGRFALLLVLFVSALPAATLTIDIQARIDGRSLLIGHVGTLQWHNLTYCAPGLHWNTCGDVNLPTVISTTVNGAPNPYVTNLNWTPTWPSGPGGDVYSTTDAIWMLWIPCAITSMNVTTVLGRTTVGLVQIPSSSNGCSMILDFDDDAQGGSADYLAHVTAEFVPEPASCALMAAGLFGLFAIRRWNGAR